MCGGVYDSKMERLHFVHMCKWLFWLELWVLVLCYGNRVFAVCVGVSGVLEGGCVGYVVGGGLGWGEGAGL